MLDFLHVLANVVDQPFRRHILLAARALFHFIEHRQPHDAIEQCIHPILPLDVRLRPALQQHGNHLHIVDGGKHQTGVSAGLLDVVGDAKEHGDLSENAEYEDAKNEQAFVEGRIQTLEALIKNATIIDEHHSTDHVQIGSTVKVESDDGEESFTIVGSTEAKPAEGRISNESPVGRALLGKKKGEKVVVRVPAGDFTYKVTGIS